MNMNEPAPASGSARRLRSSRPAPAAAPSPGGVVCPLTPRPPPREGPPSGRRARDVTSRARARATLGEVPAPPRKGRATLCPRRRPPEPASLSQLRPAPPSPLRSLRALLLWPRLGLTAPRAGSAPELGSLDRTPSFTANARPRGGPYLKSPALRGLTF